MKGQDFYHAVILHILFFFSPFHHCSLYWIPMLVYSSPFEVFLLKPNIDRIPNIGLRCSWICQRGERERQFCFWPRSYNPGWGEEKKVIAANISWKLQWLQALLAVVTKTWKKCFTLFSAQYNNVSMMKNSQKEWWWIKWLIESLPHTLHGVTLE